ncbi:MAG TPA: nuclear transport factor 2 family protein [Allosphingosinicella sp.]|nr:nuclear transport factor 2 family protein [Allosphingosinicella sp.]
MGTREIVEALVAAVNSGKPERIIAAMDPDAVFVDSLGERLEGRAALLDGWRGYLRLFPDYRIEVEAMFVEEREALLHGWAGATLYRGGRPVADGGWRIPAAWRATTDSRRVTLWQVFADNGPVAALLAR